jgi:hypothetical protein
MRMQSLTIGKLFLKYHSGGGRLTEYQCINPPCQWTGTYFKWKTYEFTDDDDNSKTFHEKTCPKCGSMVFRKDDE